MKNATFVLIALCLLFTPATLAALDLEERPGTDTWWAPDYIRAQFAGDFGLVSSGPGYSFLDRHLATDLSYGFTPLFGGATVHQFNLEVAVDPIHLNIGSNLELHPIRLGAFGTYFAGRDFWSREPEKFGGGYDLINRFIAGPAIGSSLFVPTTHRGAFDGVDVYWRASIHNLAARYAEDNGEAISLRNVYSLGFGLRLYL